ncbi:MAG TPA: TonB-dependent receptor [Longimicrobium sp.]|nr:TonB-dependent receptor [Longimicrobium sp.]
MRPPPLRAVPARPPSRVRAFAVFAAAAALALASPAAVHAQATCARGVEAAGRAWEAPLDRPVTLRTGELTLRDALDRLSAAARVRLSYSSELLPLDRRVCVSIARRPLGDALASLVGAAGAEPVVIGGQVVLAPATPSTTGSVAARESVLERIVATGSAAGAARRPLTVGLGVVEGTDAANRSASTMADLLNGSVPGMWIWRRSPTTLLSQYGSVRGSSSFGATYPKVYIDGVETANPLVLTELDPDWVERVEVIRGPQGAALYGSDAISGVVNIVTRHEGAGGGAPRLELRSEAGLAGSGYTTRTIGTHRQRLVLRAGSNLRSLGVSVGFGGAGGVYPGAQTRQVAAHAAGRIVGPHAILTTTLRLYDQRAGAASNPLLAGIVPATQADSVRTSLPQSADSARQSLREYTAGATLKLAPGGGWTYALVAGIDGYRLNHQADSTEPFPAAVADPLERSRGGADRGTLRGSATTRLGAEGPLSTDVTLAIEHTLLREAFTERMLRIPERGGRWMVEELGMREAWRQNTGVLAQAAASWRNTAFATGGVRVETNDALAGATPVSVLPMLGAAWVRPLGPAEVKLRAAYGRGIRPARTPARHHLYAGHGGGFAPPLEPEAQAGTELGMELHLPRVGSLQVTRFDQRATGLIQNVALGADTFSHAGAAYRRVRYQLQNVGEITNRGWEMEGSLKTGALSLSAALSLVDSRVQRMAESYGGDLRAGDRVLGVPARSGGLTARWEAGGWYGSASATRAWDWIGYDRLALARDFAAGATQPRVMYGVGLRDYWRSYEGTTELRGTLSREVGRGVRVTVAGDNLLGSQLGEPDNATIRAGRTFTLGVRTTF